MTDRQAELIELIHKEVKPALGCTEPIAVALAVAKAVDIISENCSHCGDCPLWRQTADFRIAVEVSGNILKNGMGVGIRRSAPSAATRTAGWKSSRVSRTAPSPAPRNWSPRNASPSPSPTRTTFCT